MAIVVVGNVFVDIKGFPEDLYIPGGRNSGSVQIVHGGVGRNVAEDIGNVELRPVLRISATSSSGPCSSAWWTTRRRARRCCAS